MTVRHNTFMGHILKRQDESQGLYFFSNGSMLQYELCLPVRRGSKLTMLSLCFFKLLMEFICNLQDDSLWWGKVGVNSGNAFTSQLWLKSFSFQWESLVPEFSVHKMIPKSLYAFTFIIQMFGNTWKWASHSASLTSNTGIYNLCVLCCHV